MSQHSVAAANNLRDRAGGFEGAHSLCCGSRHQSVESWQRGWAPATRPPLTRGVCLWGPVPPTPQGASNPQAESEFSVPASQARACKPSPPARECACRPSPSAPQARVPVSCASAPPNCLQPPSRTQAGSVRVGGAFDPPKARDRRETGLGSRSDPEPPVGVAPMWGWRLLVPEGCWRLRGVPRSGAHPAPRGPSTPQAGACA